MARESGKPPTNGGKAWVRGLSRNLVTVNEPPGSSPVRVSSLRPDPMTRNTTEGSPMHLSGALMGEVRPRIPSTPGLHRAGQRGTRRDQSSLLWNLATAPERNTAPSTAMAAYWGHNTSRDTPLRKMPRTTSRKYLSGFR